jgi:hypothetical protein
MNKDEILRDTHPIPKEVYSLLWQYLNIIFIHLFVNPHLHYYCAGPASISLSLRQILECKPKINSRSLAQDVTGLERV